MGINYNRNGINLTISVTEGDGAKLGIFKCTIHERKKYGEILRYLDDKFGFKPEIDVKDSVNNDFVGG